VNHVYTFITNKVIHDLSFLNVYFIIHNYETHVQENLYATFVWWKLKDK